jgi:hypothetical protein
VLYVYMACVCFWVCGVYLKSLYLTSLLCGSIRSSSASAYTYRPHTHRRREKGRVSRRLNLYHMVWCSALPISACPRLYEGDMWVSFLGSACVLCGVYLL